MFVTLYIWSHMAWQPIPCPLALCVYTHTKGWYLRVTSRRVDKNSIEFYSTRIGTFLTLRRGNQITIDTESERQSDCPKLFAIQYHSTLELYNNYSFSIYNLFLLQEDYMAQPLQTASLAIDEQLISSTVTQEIRLQDE